MIRELRLRHQRTIPIFAIASGLIFFCAIFSRKEIPVMESMQTETPSAQAPIQTLKFSVLTELQAAVFPGKLQLTVNAPLKLADPLVYWTLSDMNNAQLLGALPASGSKTYALDQQQGAILIYSLAHQEIVDQLSLAPEDSP